MDFDEFINGYLTFEYDLEIPVKEKNSEEEIMQQIIVSGDIMSAEESSHRLDVQEASYNLVPLMKAST